jgi:hypothetical protein
MIRATRASSWVRAALCAAALLSLFAAFGLHPEPAGAGAPAARASLAAKASPQAAAHDCIACLNGATAVLAAPAGLAPVAADAVAAIFHHAPEPPARLETGNLSGRSPPAGASL